MAPKNQNPTHGQKVDLGENAPVKEEGAGKVASESLAAESTKEGGEFASNEGIRGENQPSSASENISVGHNTDTSSAPSSKSTQSSSGKSSADKSSAGRTTKTSSALGSNADSKSGQSGSANSGTAPSYVENQYIRSSSGPHGKNATEGFDDSKTKDGLKLALESEPGSENDPSRLAEQQFQERQNAVGRDAGPRQSALSSETPFDSLNNETSS
ncbi:hypothetical protein FVEN_g7443 [Fusarium venenatum]|uniref:Uncharacterized protein n=1 Tax=Fusarium venenatum TaxID=56646 RepID=A0A2L2T7K5_9HYPO|nr:uncharacterized protein FVRRES_02400 [Fusarium venenatum]KAG8354679.1 hypothetical protein FVEN_g7443 [Fusarium venenatum]KAH7004494.1 hypothetical protein EDB82DRAFT_50047 [Fusarium venenatum]CEI65888.1 unnamed protein product [Fusarium venenatum]